MANLIKYSAPDNTYYDESWRPITIQQASQLLGQNYTLRVYYSKDSFVDLSGLQARKYMESKSGPVSQVGGIPHEQQTYQQSRGRQSGEDTVTPQQQPPTPFSVDPNTGLPPPPRPEDFPIYDKTTGTKVIGYDYDAYINAYDAWQSVTQQGGYAPGAGSYTSPAEYINAVISGIQSDIAARRLRTDQLVEEFNRRFNLFSEAGSRFEGLQPYTIPAGSEYIPGFEPSGFAQSIGLNPMEASPINYNPYEQAQAVLSGVPSPTTVGAPDAQWAIDLAKSFLGG